MSDNVWDGQQYSVGDKGDVAPGRPTTSSAARGRFGSWNLSWSVGSGGTTEQWPPPATETR